MLIEVTAVTNEVFHKKFKIMSLQVKASSNIEIHLQWLCNFNLNNIGSRNTKQDDFNIHLFKFQFRKER